MSNVLGDHVYALRRTAIAACAVGRYHGLRVFFQDYDGGIRQIRYEWIGGYRGGDQKSVIAAASDAKYHTALAAVSSTDPTKEISLFYIGRDNHLRGIVYNKSCWEPMYSLNSMDIAVCPASGLAALRYNQGKNLRIWYQQPDLKIRELAQQSEGPYTLTDFAISAVVGSSLACCNWFADDESLQELTFFYQDPNCEMTSAFFIPSVGHWEKGYLHIPNMPPGSGSAAIAHRHLGYNADIVRTYETEPDGLIKERWWRSDTEQWGEAPHVQGMIEGKVCGCWYTHQDSPEIRLFYQGTDGSIMGYNFQGKKWTNEHRLPSGD